MKPHASSENYLEAIFILQKEKEMTPSIDVSEYMCISNPSVSHAVKPLRKGGFLMKDSDRFLELTDLGQETTEKFYDRYQYFVKHLACVSVDTVIAEEEACRMEHTLSHESLQLLKEQKQNTCPFVDSCQFATDGKTRTDITEKDS